MTAWPDAVASTTTAVMVDHSTTGIANCSLNCRNVRSGIGLVLLLGAVSLQLISVSVLRRDPESIGEKLSINTACVGSCSRSIDIALREVGDWSFPAKGIQWGDHMYHRNRSQVQREFKSHVQFISPSGSKVLGTI